MVTHKTPMSIAVAITMLIVIHISSSNIIAPRKIEVPDTS